MTEDMTMLDRAGQAMAAAPEDGATRLRFYERLADAELFLLLTGEPDGDRIEPKLIDLDDGPVVLAFDREERLAGFVGGPADFVAMSGRHVVHLLAGQGIALGVNFGVAASETLLPAAAVDWLARTLQQRPSEALERPSEVAAPGAIPEAVLAGLDVKLAMAAGLARVAYLVKASYEAGRSGHMLAFVDARPGAEAALANAVGEALTFSGIEAGELDVAFFAASDAISARLAKVGLRFDLPEPEQAEVVEISPPGMDPDAPPILR